MKAHLVASVLAASFVVFPVIAAETNPAENLLADTRWMEIGPADTTDTIKPERMLMIRLCTIADVAFIIREGHLTRYDRAVLSNKAQPIPYEKVESSAAQDGGTLIVLYTSDAGMSPARIRMEAGGEILRTQNDSGDGPAYMKCRMQQ